MVAFACLFLTLVYPQVLASFITFSAYTAVLALTVYHKWPIQITKLIMANLTHILKESLTPYLGSEMAAQILKQFDINQPATVHIKTGEPLTSEPTVPSPYTFSGRYVYNDEPRRPQPLRYAFTPTVPCGTVRENITTRYPPVSTDTSEQNHPVHKIHGAQRDTPKENTSLPSTVHHKDASGPTVSTMFTGAIGSVNTVEPSGIVTEVMPLSDQERIILSKMTPETAQQDISEIMKRREQSTTEELTADASQEAKRQKA